VEITRPLTLSVLELICDEFSAVRANGKLAIFSKEAEASYLTRAPARVRAGCVTSLGSGMAFRLLCSRAAARLLDIMINRKNSVPVKFEGQRFLGSREPKLVKMVRELMAHRRFEDPAELIRTLMREDYDYRVRPVQIVSPSGRQAEV